MTDRKFKILGWFLTAAVAGLGIFSFLAWQAVTVESTEARAARAAFDAVRETYTGQVPMLVKNAEGQFVPHPQRTGNPATDVSRLRVLAYRVHQKRLVRAEVPFWFFRLKSPAAQLALRETGFDLKRLAVTPADIKDHGAGIVVDDEDPDGDALLVWAE